MFQLTDPTDDHAGLGPFVGEEFPLRSTVKYLYLSDFIDQTNGIPKGAMRILEGWIKVITVMIFGKHKFNGFACYRRDIRKIRKNV